MSPAINERRLWRRSRKQKEQQAQAQYQQGAEGYNRALSACLGGRGYVVQ
jgi:hypothetical protein